ncbi:hypothetical protein C8Q80DRAFT_1198649 [Daedaleopsis nitida]|nr:hypothetical protein C8Q80DRAFT_1198649 [Daedaleopsis nitida]
MGSAETHVIRKCPPSKRRRIAHLQVTPTPVLPARHTGITVLPVCASCHRGFTGSKQIQLVLCARCHSPTCPICSRTCNGCPSSVPPTPALTTAPSPPDTPLASPLPSARRPALALNTNNTSGATPTTQIAGRRRKARDCDEEERDEAQSRKFVGDGALLGCGRAVCRNCSFETPESDLTTCYDCASRSPLEA